ncbi:hypothetical protein RRG08_059403 [Elysia crispata]|uniref:Uncharacterized protein n=1 Tax=Elysia crispata TaxID=231223 RepID=A0AAE0ZHA3_9GAST|nr:hypothetical protein RRG08_059403 [Elysia crispata]
MDGAGVEQDLTFPPFSPLSHLTVGASSRHFPPSVDFSCNSASPKAVALPSQLIFFFPLSFLDGLLSHQDDDDTHGLTLILHHKNPVNYPFITNMWPQNFAINRYVGSEKAALAELVQTFCNIDSLFACGKLSPWLSRPNVRLRQTFTMNIKTKRPLAANFHHEYQDQTSACGKLSP